MWCMVRVSLCYECSFPLVEMCRNRTVQIKYHSAGTQQCCVIAVSAGVVVVVVVKVYKLEVEV